MSSFHTDTRGGRLSGLHLNRSSFTVLMFLAQINFIKVYYIKLHLNSSLSFSSVENLSFKSQFVKKKPRIKDTRV